jgi:hypothetical protein
MQGRVSEVGTARRARASPSEGDEQFGPCCTCGVLRLYAVWADATEAIQKYGAMLKSPTGYPVQSPMRHSPQNTSSAEL